MEFLIMKFSNRRICFLMYVIFGVRFDGYSIAITPDNLSTIQKLRIFYAAPVTKFCSNLVRFRALVSIFANEICDRKISHLLFITLYTFVVLFDIQRHMFTWPEILLHFWALSHLITFLRELVILSVNTCLKMSKQTHPDMFEYSKPGVWARLELFALAFHLAGFIMRTIPLVTLNGWNENDTWRDIIRLLFCLSNAFFYIKLFRYYMVSSYLGPKLFVIRRMFHDVFMFISILIVVMMAYAVAAQALLYPDRDFYWGIFRDILYYPYWEMYGELDLENTIEGKREGCEAGGRVNEDGDWCPRAFWPVAIMMSAYLLVSNILLVNLLIAMFTHVFEEAQQHSNEIWKDEMYQLACEFDNQPFFPPPLNVPENIYRLIAYIVGVCRHRRVAHRLRLGHKQSVDTNTHFYLTQRQIENIQLFERECMWDHLKSAEEKLRLEIRTRVETIENQLDTLNKRTEESHRRLSVHLDRLQSETATKFRSETARSLSRMIREVECRLKTLETWSSEPDTARQRTTKVNFVNESEL